MSSFESNDVTICKEVAIPFSSLFGLPDVIFILKLGAISNNVPYPEPAALKYLNSEFGGSTGQDSGSKSKTSGLVWASALTDLSGAGHHVALLFKKVGLL